MLIKIPLGIKNRQFSLNIISETMFHMITAHVAIQT